MAVRPVVIWPDERLRQPSVAIATVDASVRALYQDLVDSMYAENGLGMAALTDPPLAFINPEVIETSEEQQDSEEGCLSFPDVYVKVKRPMRCKIRATGLDGAVFEIEGEALFARCLLHENDHLTGKLLVDYVGPLKRQMIKKKLQKHKAADGDEVEL
ncbi:MAG: peptide deformylase [Deltaproteobacteria bacterium]|nr:MAG: peptide deformylase [Deltaproteobacteria bacterium]